MPYEHKNLPMLTPGQFVRLGGMGPIWSPQTEGGKLFAGCHALYAGLMFLIVAGIIWAPVVHRILHRFHLDESDQE